MATLGEYIGAGSGTTKLLLHLNGSSADSSGNSNNGSDTNITYSQANGKFGQGAGFNGSSSRISITSSAFIPTSPFTVNILLKTTATNLTGILFKGNSIETSQVGCQLNGGKARFNCRSGGDQPTDGNIAVNDGKFHLVTFTYNGSGSSGTLTIYVDGKYDNSRSMTNMNNISYNTVIGQLGDSSNSSYYYNGSIDEVIVDARAWSAEEVKKYYTNAKGRFFL